MVKCTQSSSTSKVSARQTQSAKPASHSLADAAKFFLGRLSDAERKQFKQAVATAQKEKRNLTVGTMCSGTDSPVAVLKHLQKALGGKVGIEHTFSCEWCPKKQEWIKQNFTELEYLFKDVYDVGKGKAENLITGQQVKVPAVDIVIAGFVCKSVSTENNERQKYANCIKEAVGETGETFDGVLNYVRKYKPSLVICENVSGLTKRNKGNEPVVNHVMRKFKGAGYSASYQVLDSRNFLLPHRRQRCWMWAFLGANEANRQAAEQKVPAMLEKIQTDKGLSMNQMLRAAKSKKPKHTLNARRRTVIKAAKLKVKGGWQGKDLFIDVAKSDKRAPQCVDAVSCLVPNSMPYRVKEGRVLQPKEFMYLQGIYDEDFPALSDFAEKKGGLVRDLAGNAFTTTVCMAVLIAAMSHSDL